MAKRAFEHVVANWNKETTLDSLDCGSRFVTERWHIDVYCFWIFKNQIYLCAVAKVKLTSEI